jgi:hypothetical protein
MPVNGIVALCAIIRLVVIFHLGPLTTARHLYVMSEINSFL